MPIYLNIPGITGDSTSAQYTGWFTVSSFSWGETLSTGGSTGGGAGKAVATAFNVTKTAVGEGSPLLFVACATGKHLQTVSIVVTAHSRDAEVVQESFTLGNALITSYQIGGDSGARPVDNLSILFEKLTYEQTYLNSQNQSATFDFSTNQGD